MRVQSLGQEGPLVEDMTPHSSIPAWWATVHRVSCKKSDMTEAIYHALSVAQPWLTLCSPKDCSPPGSPAHGIFQARIPEWGAISYSTGSS